MNESHKLIQEAVGSGRFRSYYEIAKAIGKDPSYVRHIRAERAAMNDYAAFVIAERLGMDPMKTIARVNLDRARSEQERKLWRSLSHGSGQARPRHPAPQARAAETVGA